MAWDRTGLVAAIRQNLAAVLAALGSGTPSSSTVLYGDGRWAAPGGGGGSSADTFRTISAFPATIASDDVVLEITATGSLALPTPTAGRKLIFKATKASGAILTLTRASSGVEDYDGALKNSTSLIAGEGRTYRGNGSVWQIFPG